MKLVLIFALCLLICYIHVTTSEQSAATGKSNDKMTKEKNKASAKTKEKSKEFSKNAKTAKQENKKSAKDTNGRTAMKDKNQGQMKNPNNRNTETKSKRSPQIRTPFDKVLDKLANCATSSPSLVEVMEENLKELQSDEKYQSLFHAAPHTAAFLKKKKTDSTKFIFGLRQSLSADWSNPAWKSADEIDTLFRPFKQQFVYAMMRFNCTS